MLLCSDIICIYCFTRVRFDGVLLEFGDITVGFKCVAVGKHVRCWSILRDCKRLRSEKKSSSGNVLAVDVSSNESFDQDSNVVVVACDVVKTADAVLGLGDESWSDVLWLCIGISTARWSSRRESFKKWLIICLKKKKHNL